MSSVESVSRGAGKLVGRTLAVVFFFCILFLGVGFASLNSEPVSVNYYVGTFSASLAAVVVGAFLLGVVGAFLVTLGGWFGNRLRTGSMERRLKAQEREITTLREQQVRRV